MRTLAASFAIVLALSVFLAQPAQAQFQANWMHGNRGHHGNHGGVVSHTARAVGHAIGAVARGTAILVNSAVRASTYPTYGYGYGYQTPVYQQNYGYGYQTPVYQTPVYQTPVYQTPVYQTPTVVRPAVYGTPYTNNNNRHHNRRHFRR